MEFRTQFNYTPEAGEEVQGVTMTIQGEAYSIQELILKMHLGQMPAVSKTPIYADADSFDDSDFNQVGQMDIVDRQELSNEMSMKVKENQKIIKDFKQRQETEMIEKKAKEMVDNQRLAEQKTKNDKVTGDSQ